MSALKQNLCLPVLGVEGAEAAGGTCHVLPNECWLERDGASYCDEVFVMLPDLLTTGPCYRGEVLGEHAPSPGHRGLSAHWEAGSVKEGVRGAGPAVQHGVEDAGLRARTDIHDLGV